jgi:hypothetical protein
MTVCISFAAPTMASNGQAATQSVQPMQVASSMRATGRGPGVRGRIVSMSIGGALRMAAFYRPGHARSLP